MAKATVFKKSIWRKIDEKTDDLKTELERKKAKFKSFISEPANLEKAKKAAVWTAGALIFVLEVRKQLQPTIGELERRKKRYSYYDPHSHIRFDTKRALRPETAYEIRKRTAAGEDVLDILREMKLC